MADTKTIIITKATESLVMRIEDIRIGTNRTIISGTIKTTLKLKKKEVAMLLETEEAEEAQHLKAEEAALKAVEVALKEEEVAIKTMYRMISSSEGCL